MHRKDVQVGPKETGVSLPKRQHWLIIRLRTGNKEAACELVDNYYEQIYLFMRRLGHGREVSEDLTQDCFLQAWQHIGQLRTGKSLNGWLYRIAINVSRLYWRRHRGEKTVEIGAIEPADSGGSDAGDRAAKAEQLSRLKAAVSALPEKLRQVIVLHYMQYLTIAEAAEAADVREGTFKSRLSRALKVLKKRVD